MAKLQKATAKWFTCDRRYGNERRRDNLRATATASDFGFVSEAGIRARLQHVRFAPEGTLLSPAHARVFAVDSANANGGPTGPPLQLYDLRSY